MKKQKALRTKWSYERAKQLDQERLTQNLTWEKLASKHGQTAGAIKASIQRWLKIGPNLKPMTKDEAEAAVGVAQVVERSTRDEAFQFAERAHILATRQAKAWAEIMELTKP